MSLMTFEEFICEQTKSKKVKFNPDIMRWITIHDKNNQQQRLLIKKKDGTILGGMGGTETGEKLDNVFNDLQKKKSKESMKNFDDNALKGNDIHDQCSISEKSLTDSEAKSFKRIARTALNRINKAVELTDYGSKDASAKKDVENIHNVLKKYKLPKPIVTYLGVSDDEMNDLALKPGDTWSKKGFNLTTTKEFMAKDNAENEQGIEGYVFELHLPKGTHAASIADVAQQGNFEVLIDKNSKYIVQDVDHDKQKVVLKLQQD